jgi:hypothetical protein
MIQQMVGFQEYWRKRCDGDSVEEKNKSAGTPGT